MRFSHQKYFYCHLLVIPYMEINLKRMNFNFYSKEHWPNFIKYVNFLRPAADKVLHIRRFLQPWCPPLNTTSPALYMWYILYLSVADVVSGKNCQHPAGTSTYWNWLFIIIFFFFFGGGRICLREICFTRTDSGPEISPTGWDRWFFCIDSMGMK